MKKLLFSILIYLTLGAAALQGANPTTQTLERVYVSTDRNCYVAGDELFVSAFCIDASSEDGRLSTLSKVAYIELQNSTGTVQTMKVALDGGRGCGSMSLYTDLPTGNYALIAYTSQNLAEKGFVPVAKFITIYNVLSLKRVPGGVEVSEKDRPVAQGNVSDESNGFQIIQDKNWKANSSGSIRLKNPFNEAVTLSVSVYHEDQLCSVSTSTLPAVVNSNGWRNVKATIDDSYIPEYEGEMIRLKISDNVEPGRMLSVSFPGRQPDYYFVTIDNNHLATLITKNVPGERDMVCEPYPLDTTLQWSVEIEDNFLRPTPQTIPLLTLYPEQAKALTERGIAMQLSHRFNGDTIVSALKGSNRIRLTSPDKTYLLDDYTRFPLMQEVIIEYVSEIQLRHNRRHNELKVLQEGVFHESYADDINSIIFLDGMPVLDHDRFLKYSPLLVRQLDVFKRSFIEGTTFYSGAANFQTYKGNLSGWNFAENVRILRFHGVSVPTELTFMKQGVPNPSTDYRQTLYWKPLMSMPAASEQTVKVATPCYKGHFTILVEGMTQSGRTFSATSTFECE